jgi:hypothetical protein
MLINGVLKLSKFYKTINPYTKLSIRWYDVLSANNFKKLHDATDDLGS